ncbi:Uncharacterised protein [Candidatus Bilamarchaeum dharawalense]|uniref:Thioredoxin-like fold domain-containing protein n=1 Tax=Candidatus Bilamarchaeum dharawalense TaxID=2885759 RepID=A0A5E4LSB3_9ARCH|nr:Uncharacterised protein [Candidatus Bilamarchaeum dharawalense]
MTDKGETVAISKEMLFGIVIVLLAALLVVSIMTQGFGILKPNVVVSGNQTAGQKLSDADLKLKVETYINANLLAAPYTSEVTKIEPFDSYLNLVTVSIKNAGSAVGTEQVYVSNDGSAILVGRVFKTSEKLNTTTTTDQGQTPTVDKTARPKAQVFVMAFCPYGLQFLKAYVPVMELLGDKADIEVHFVDYAMHGKKELDGNNYLYCVQKEEKAKLPAYIRCFVTAGDYQGCVATAGLDSTKIQSCVAQTDSQYSVTSLYNDQSTWVSGQYPQYPVEAALNEQYGVQGSPTFVLNGKTVSVGRSAEAIKQAVCAAFTTPPAECQTVLRSDQEAAGLGAAGSGVATSGSAQCG